MTTPTTADQASVPAPRRPRRWRRLVKRILLTLITLLLLILALAYWLLGTASGYRQLPKLINRLTPYTLTYDQLDGALLGSQHWQNLHLSGGGLDIRAADLHLDLRAGELLRGDIHLAEVALSDATITLPPGGDAPKPASTGESATTPTQLPAIDLPVDLNIGQLRLSNITLKQQQKPILHIESADLAAAYRDSTLTTRGNARTDKGSFDLDASLTTRDDYPLTLKLSGDTPLTTPPQTLTLDWQQSLLKPRLSLALGGMASGGIDLDANIDLAGRQLQGTLVWHDLAYEEHRSHGSLDLNGAFDTLSATLDADYSHPDSPPAHLTLNTDIHGAALKNTRLNLAALGGRVEYSGDADFSGSPAWNGTLTIRDIDSKKYNTALDLQLDGDIRTHGGNGHAALTIESLKGRWQNHPVSGSGSLAYDGNTLTARDLQLALAGNSVRANGSAAPERADLDLNLTVPALERLVPIVAGDIQARVHLGGNLLAPTINGDLNWRNLTVGDKQNPITYSKQGSAHAEGPFNRLAVTVNGDARGRHYPPLTLKGTATLDPLHRIENIDFDIRSLQGKVHLTGSSDYLPHVAWDARATAENLHPGDWPLLKTLQNSSLSAELASKGGYRDNKTTLTASINKLRGNWHKQPLSGNAAIKLDGANLDLDTLDLRLGDNHLTASGKLHGSDLDLNYTADGKQLAALYPGLGGNLRGKGKLSGKLTNPAIQSQLSGQNLAWGAHKIASLQADINTAHQKNGAYHNRIQLGGVQTGDQRWQNIQLTTDGTYQNHRLNLTTTGGEANLKLAMQGGFSAADQWRGDLSTLELAAYDNTLRLQHRAALQLGAKNLAVRDLCLADQYSSLCLDLKHDKQTELAYRIREINPKSLGKHLPASVSLNTALTGNGNLTRSASGQIRGDADLQLKPGNITIRAKGQPPLNLPLKTARLATRFTDKQAESTLTIDMGDNGHINGHARISDYRRQNLSGDISLNLPDIGKYRNFIPKASELKGRINGTLNLGGTISAPVASGSLQLEGGSLKIPEYATELNNIRLKLSAARSGQIDINGNIGTPDGNLDTTGTLNLAPTRLDLRLNGRNMLIANSKKMQITISPDFKIRIDPTDGIDVQGKIHVPKASISIPDTSGGVDISKDVVVLGEGESKEEAAKKRLAAPPPVPFKADIAVTLGDKVYFKNKDVNIRLKGDITIIERPKRPLTAKGTIEVASGIYQLYGQELDIKHGRATYSGGSITNPTIDVLALRNIDNKDIKVGASVTGPADRLRLKLTSTPKMPDSAILSYLLFGRSPDGTMDNEALLQTAASLSLGGVLPGGDIGKQTGLDVFDLGVSGLKAGKYLTSDIYVGMKSNFFTGVTEFIARYQINKRFSVEASAGAGGKSGGNAIDFLYEFEKD